MDRSSLAVLPIIDGAVSYPDLTSKLLLRETKASSKLFYEHCDVDFCHVCLPLSAATVVLGV